jgi:hypothetical protein
MIISIWLTIVSSLVVFAVAVMLLTRRARADAMQRIEFLMDAHRANLRSGDPERIAESKRGWKEMCRRMQRDNPRFGGLFLNLEEWGDKWEG